MDLIDSKVTQGHYPTVDSLLDDLAQLFDNAYCSYSAETTQSKVIITVQCINPGLSLVKRFSIKGTPFLMCCSVYGFNVFFLFCRTQ